MLVLEVLSQMLVLFSIMMVGYALRKLNIIDDASTKGMSAILTKLALPCAVFMSMQKPFTKTLLLEVGQTMLLFTLIQFGSLLLGYIIARLLRVQINERAIYMHTLMFCNVSFMGYPVLVVLVGEEALFYASFCNIGQTLLIFSLGIALFAFYSGGGESRSTREKLSMIFLNPTFVIGVIGFIFFLLSISIPQPVSRAVEMLGGLTTPISMIVIGSMLTQNKLKELVEDWKQYILAVFRLIIISLLVFLICRVFVKNEVLLLTLTVVAAMPMAATSPILAAQYKSNAVFASRVAFITTLLSVITIPFIASIILR